MRSKGIASTGLRGRGEYGTVCQDVCQSIGRRKAQGNQSSSESLSNSDQDMGVLRLSERLECTDPRAPVNVDMVKSVCAAGKCLTARRKSTSFRLRNQDAVGYPTLRLSAQVRRYITHFSLLLWLASHAF